MNKKIIAIAIAAAMAAPVAMADMKVSGRVAMHLSSLDTDGAADAQLGYGDQGQARIQFDATAGDVFARAAWDGRKSKNLGQRENYVGYKFANGMAAQFGRMAGAAKNIEKDPYIATFLQTRKTIAESATASNYGSSSFISSLAQLSFKVGAAKVKVQYDVASNSKDYSRGASTNEGHTSIAVTGKAGAVSYWAGYNNGTADGNNSSATTSQSNIKLGGAMKFGTVKVSLNYTSMDKDGAAGEGNATDSILVMANMGMGDGMSVNAAIATRSGDVAADDATYMRLAVMKKLNKSASIYAGYTVTDYDDTTTKVVSKNPTVRGPQGDTTEIGVGMTVKF